MAPPHSLSVSKVHDRSRTTVLQKSTHLHSRKISSPSRSTSRSKSRKVLHREPARQPTRLNKTPLSGDRIAKSKALSLQASDARVGKRRRRPAIKRDSTALLEGLKSLEEALPLDDAARTRNDAQGGNGMAKRALPVVKSLKSRPGAQKKRAKLERNERERFEWNLAALSSVNQQQLATGNEKTVEEIEAAKRKTKWEALRRHIAGNLGAS